LNFRRNPFNAQVDRQRFCQVANNLMSNAVKFTPKEGRIIWRLFRGAWMASLGIRDRGVGIKAEDLSHIFEVFFQGDVASNVRQAGLGIGLPVVKNLVELHGATIEARSDGEGTGAEFIVRVPAPHNNSMRKSLFWLCKMAHSIRYFDFDCTRSQFPALDATYSPQFDAIPRDAGRDYRRWVAIIDRAMA
jgi:hypothetical protein